MSVQLSTHQQQVVDHRGSPLQVIACAGSGKTESISRRVAALIAEGAEPASIVAFTFTERAAAELKERIVRRVAERMGEDFKDRLGPMFVGTIHGYCFHLLQDYVPRYGSYDVLDPHRHAGFLAREFRSLGLSKLGAKKWAPIRDFAHTVDVIANELIKPADLAGTPLGECYEAYLAALDRYHFMTFGLQIVRAVEALENPTIFERVHGPLRHLVVDEYQDVNPAQERLIELLSQSPVQLCVVGDDEQSIFQWRGSDIRNILGFVQRRPDAATVTLATNRRSRPEIVRAANRFSSTIPERLEKEMEPARPSGDYEVVAWRAATDVAEAERVAETIEHLHENGFQYRDIAVLYRSVRTSAPLLIDALRSRGIPFSCGGRTGLFMQPDVALLGEAYAWLSDCDWRDQRYGESRPSSLDTVVNGLASNFGRDPVVLKRYLEDWKKFLLRGSQSINLVGDLYQLLAVLGAHQIDLTTKDGVARFGALARFSQVLADFEHTHRRGRYVDEEGKREFRGGQDRGKSYLQTLANYLLHYARDAYEDFEGEEVTEIDAVDILTVHQAKGLEWPVVFLPALVNGRFPSRFAGQSQDWLLPESVFPSVTRARYEGSDAEERRLFYVAMTRARDCLYLSRFERKTNAFKPSPYLVDVAGRDHMADAELPIPTPAEERSPEPPPLGLPFSDIARFEDCGHNYRLGSVLGFQQDLALELGYGKAIHHVLRILAERARETGTVPTSAEIRQLVDDEFYLPFANRPAFERMYQAANRLVRTYVEQYVEDLGRIWATERPFELYLPDGVVTGRADVILDMEGGQIGSLAIVDYKSANDPRRDERYRWQLAVYAAAGRGEGLNVEAAYLHELREGVRKSVDLGDPALVAARERASQILADIRTGSFPARPETKRCGLCEFRRICSHRAPEA
jgi:DNA helicase-2/ATP-dependent DNA helicase PcrA